MFENRRMPNGTSEPSLGLCGVGGRACEGSLYPIARKFLRKSATKFCCCFGRAHVLKASPPSSVSLKVGCSNVNIALTLEI